MEFLRVHHMGVKAMAVHDEAMLSLVCDLLPMETSAGDMTIAQLIERAAGSSTPPAPRTTARCCRSPPSRSGRW